MAGAKTHRLVRSESQPGKRVHPNSKCANLSFALGFDASSTIFRSSSIAPPTSSMAVLHFKKGPDICDIAHTPHLNCRLSTKEVPDTVSAPVAARQTAVIACERHRRRQCDL